jgi:hypothetical protein
MLICYSTFARDNDKQWVGWLIFVVSITIGIGVGFVFIKYPKIGGFALASWGGFSMGLLIYDAFLYKIESQAALWSFAVGLGLLYGIILLFFFDHILIHSTAMLGSFMFIYGIGMVAGHYANPFTIVELLDNNQFDSIDPLFYAYFGGNLVLYGLGCFWQYYKLSQERKLNNRLSSSYIS